MAEKDIKLFTDFPPVSTEAWEAKINADLKGKDYERALVWKTNEGFNVRPYYREENIKELGHTDIKPGEYPYVRGTKKDNDWFIRQDIKVEDLKAANAKALNVLGKGINSLGFVFENCTNLTAADLDVLLKDICLEAAEVNFVCCCNNTNLATLLSDYIKAGKWDNEKVKASVNVDPIGTFTLTGKMEADFAAMKNLVDATQEVKNLRVISVTGKNFTNAGSSIVQELAFSLSIGAEYLASLTEAGAEAGAAASKIKFNLGIGGNYFMELAKLRAGRMLWAEIVNAYAPASADAAKMAIHSETSIWNKTVYDPYVNMLRTQTEAMSASLGGTDSLTVLPFDATFEQPTDFAERIARNQQILLKEESHFDKIADPAAGSYYIENLTASIAEQAWTLFLEVQDKGGFVAAFREGFVQAKVAEIAAKRSKNVATRRENLLGINQFPNFTETMKINLDASVLEPVDQTVEGAEVETLKIFRGAQSFEALRYATDQFAKAGKRPKAYMLTIGNLTMRKARAQFACNFFAVAGYEVVDNNGFETVEEGVAAAKAAGADIVVICSSDDEYATLAPAAFNQLKDDAILVVAGAPACADELKAAGIENFINVKTNLLEALTAYNQKLGIK